MGGFEEAMVAQTQSQTVSRSVPNRFVAISAPEPVDMGVSEVEGLEVLKVVALALLVVLVDLGFWWWQWRWIWWICGGDKQSGNASSTFSSPSLHRCEDNWRENSYYE